MEEQQPENILLNVTCPVCSVRTPVKMTHDKEVNNFVDFTDTQKETSSYAFKGMEFCPCERLLRVSLSVTTRDTNVKND